MKKNLKKWKEVVVVVVGGVGFSGEKEECGGCDKVVVRRWMMKEAVVVVGGGVGFVD